jgi:hypothetical protein
MTSRIQPQAVAPQAIEALLVPAKYVRECGLEAPEPVSADDRMAAPVALMLLLEIEGGKIVASTSSAIRTSSQERRRT